MYYVNGKSTQMYELRLGKSTHYYIQNIESMKNMCYNREK